jgi:hypothetical protein
VGVGVLRSVLAGILCAGILGLAALAAERGFWKPSARAAEPQQIDVILGTDVIDPAVMLLLPGPVRFVVRNASGAPRVFRVIGPGVHAATGLLEDDGTGTLEVTFARPGTYAASDGRGHAAEESIRVRLP